MPVFEVATGARHGTIIAPKPPKLLAHPEDSSAFSHLIVDQQIQLVPCSILDKEPAHARTIYFLRTTEDKNRKVKAFRKARVEQFFREGNSSWGVAATSRLADRQEARTGHGKDAVIRRLTGCARSRGAHMKDNVSATREIWAFWQNGNQGSAQLRGPAQTLHHIEYATCPKGPCVFVRHKDNEGKPIPVVWGIPSHADSPAVVVSAYRPAPSRWADDILGRKS